MKSAVEKWIDLSIDDLSSSNLLYNNRHFRASYFHFQQAAEKANKAFALYGELLTEDKLNEIGHDQFKIYRKALVKQEKNVESFVQVLESYPKVNNHEIFSSTNFPVYHKSILTQISYIDSLKNYDLVNIPLTDLNGLLRQCRKLRIKELKVPSNGGTKFRTLLLKLEDFIGQFETPQAIQAHADFLEFINSKENESQLYDLIVTQILPLVLDILFINYVFYVCALITIQHSSLTRYPIDGTWPDDIYTSKLPVVKKQQEFMAMLDEALNRFQRLVILEAELSATA